MTKMPGTTTKDLKLSNIDAAPPIAKSAAKSGTGASSAAGMTTKDLLKMATSDVPVYASASPRPSGIDLSAWGKATSTVPAIAASAKK